MLCRNCNSKRANRPRGLCWRCYYAPDVRELYPSTSKLSRRGIGTGYRRSILPPYATVAMPGVPEKIEAMAERARMGVSLFRRDDAVRDIR